MKCAQKLCIAALVSLLFGSISLFAQTGEAATASEAGESSPSFPVSTKQQDIYGNYVDVNVERVGEEYLLHDPLRNIYVYHAHNGTGQFLTSDLIYRSTTGTFDDPIAITSYLNLIKVYDFYANGGVGTPLRGADGSHDEIAGNEETAGESRICLLIHYGVNEQNAHGWFEPYMGAAMVGVGDGDPASYLYQLGRAADVMAHEYQHTITHFTVDLTYMNESGAIDEAISDILGALAEGHELTDDRFWSMGEDAAAQKEGGVRSMKAPSGNYRTSFDDPYPACHELHDHNASKCDFGGVHYNSTILTHAQYKMWEEMPEFFTKEHIGALWYSVIPRLDENATFNRFKTALIETAKELGFGSNAINVMRKHLSMEEENLCTVTFLNADGSLLGKTEVERGKQAVYQGPTPTLPSTEQYHYTFSGWDEALDAVTDDITVTAKYTQTVRTYLVLFLDPEGTVLKQEYVAYGTSADPPTPPSRIIDRENEYVFTGWDKDYTSVTGESSFVAIFAQRKRKYRVAYYSEGELFREELLEYGSEIPLPAMTREGYTFDGWYLDAACTNKAEAAPLTGEYSLYAKWQKTGCNALLPAGCLFPLLPFPLFFKRKK